MINWQLNWHKLRTMRCCSVIFKFNLFCHLVPFVISGFQFFFLSCQYWNWRNSTHYYRMSETCGSISATMVIPISSDATFTDLRNAYRRLPMESPKDSISREVCGSSPVPNALIRLLTEFLRDPDIQAGWSAEHIGVK